MKIITIKQCVGSEYEEPKDFVGSESPGSRYEPVSSDMDQNCVGVLHLKKMIKLTT